MPLWIGLPLCALAALAGLPVRVGFLKAPGGALRVGAAVGPARRQGSVSLAFPAGGPALRLRFPAGERIVPLGRRGGSAAAKAALRRALRFLAGRLRAERLEALIVVNAGDAQRTVLLAALLEGALAALAALAAVRPALPLRRRVRCAFSGPGEARLMGIFSVRGGHIMLAALLFGREYCIGRIRAWINTPSKTS